eukprot:TRINITY_DN6358_c0_g1_i3.p1 TRINITY_DN6358_c0_g1~~TRINITY_DN6358_c0_g1_i3.p1  ORF type:complete len:351 (-),score=35.20 TRINITY_DN6358_c0_g1_i3:395-1321(-)
MGDIITCGNVSTDCGVGICSSETCHCPATRFGNDCSMNLSQFIGQSGFITFEFFSITLYLALTIAAGLMILSMIRNGKALKIVLLHRIGIVMIFVAAVCRTIFYATMALNESKSVHLLIFYRILFPILISIFLFQVIIWFEAMRAIISDKIVGGSDRVARSRRVYCLSFGFSIVMFVIEILFDIIVYAEAFDYSQFELAIGVMQGLVCITIAISFWICQCVITANLRKLQRNLDRSNGHNFPRYLAVAPICMSVCACITILGGLMTFALNTDTSGRDYMIVHFPLKTVEFAYCVLFLMSMGRPTYVRV